MKKSTKKRLVFWGLPDGRKNRSLTGRVIREHQPGWTYCAQFGWTSITERPGYGKARTGGTMAERTTRGFVFVLIVGGSARRLGDLIRMRMAFGIRTGETRQKQ